MGYGNLDSPLKNSLTFKTLIGHLKTLPKGAAISYGATYITHKDTKVATLPIGYADGLRRSLSNVGEVLIRGQRARIIGTVAMDQCMVDVTNIENVKVGDEVVVIGKQGQDEITLSNVAKLNNTISYEVPALINRRVPRYYIKDNKTLVVRGHVDNI
jgi:alanine racemase